MYQTIRIDNMNVILMDPEPEDEKVLLTKAQQQLKDQSIFFPAIASLMIILVGTGSTFYHFVEKWNWLDSLYFTVVTMATVGYGDFAPTKPESKIFTMLLIVVGIAVFTTFITQLLKRRGLKLTINQLAPTQKTFEKGAHEVGKVTDKLKRSLKHKR